MIKHLPARRGGERYIIGTDYREREDDESKKGRRWVHAQLALHWHAAEDRPEPKRRHHDSQYSISWSLLQQRYNFGLGFVLTHGDDEPLELSFNLWRLGNVYFRFNNWWLRILLNLDREKPLWYEGRQYGLRFGFVSWVTFLWATSTNTSGESAPGINWNSGSLHRWFFGLHRSETKTTVDAIPVSIDMPEGSYSGTATKKLYGWSYTKLPGRIRHKLFPPKYHESWDIDFPTGIPIEGKGTASYNCGMDGLFGIGASSEKSLTEALADIPARVLKDRERYGGPFNLPRAMSVKEAEEWQMSQ